MGYRQKLIAKHINECHLYLSGVFFVKKLLIICILIISIFFISGCTDKIGKLSIMSDPIKNSENTGIFSESVSAITDPTKVGGIRLGGYEAVYNNGNTISIGYSRDSSRIKEVGSEQVTHVTFNIKESDIAYRIVFKNENPVDYLYGYHDEEGRSIYEKIYWDDNGRVDPRSNGDVDRANKLIEDALEKGKKVKEQFYAKELGNW